MAAEKKTLFPLPLGPVTVALGFAEEANTRALAEYFAVSPGRGEPNLTISFVLKDHEDFPYIPESLIQAKKMEGESFTIAGDLFEGRRGDGKGEWEIAVKAILTKGSLTRVFEQLLYQGFYSACASAGSKAFLVHSSAVSARGSGYLFIGPSGMGKSTVAELSRDFGVLNDEMNIISPSDKGGFTLHPSPFNGYFPRKAAEEVPLRGIFLLRHHRECRLEPVSAGSAAAEITTQIVPPLGFEDPFTPAVSRLMMEKALSLVTAVPVHLLYFPIEGGFWPLIFNAFP